MIVPVIAAPASDSLVGLFPSATSVHELTLDSGIRLRAYARGEGPRTVLFLHGFPELAYSWRAQLADCPKGYRLVAIDMRGYGGSSAPKHVRDYAMPRLVDDVRGAIDALGERQVDLVGHDWGGAVAWEVARAYPERLRSLCVLNCPPGEVFLRAALRRPGQLRRSWYMLFFQLPWLPERLLGRDPRRFVIGAFRSAAVVKDGFTAEGLAPYIAAVEAQGVRGINYYRAALRNGRPRGRPPLIALPTRLIWGLGDSALGPWFADPTLYASVAQPFDLRVIERAGHWVQQEAPEQVNAALYEHWQRS